MTKDQAMQILKSFQTGSSHDLKLLREAIKIVSNSGLAPPQN